MENLKSVHIRYEYVILNPITDTAILTYKS